MSLREQRWPEEVRLSKDKMTLSVRFDDGAVYELAAEYLRVESPSAEVQGHSPSEKKTIGGKEAVMIVALEPVGNYAVKPKFSDGHDTGIFTWDYLYRLGRDRNEIWADYLARLSIEGLARSTSYS